MTKTNTLYQENYECKKCKSIRIINRPAKRKIGHMKHMMCTGCDGKRTLFIKVE